MEFRLHFKIFVEKAIFSRDAELSAKQQFFEFSEVKQCKTTISVQKDTASAK